jgi:hypothetical protein
MLREPWVIYTGGLIIDGKLGDEVANVAYWLLHVVCRIMSAGPHITAPLPHKELPIRV